MTMSSRLSIALLTALAICAFIRPEHAYAGTYLMRSCNVPGAASATRGPWDWSYTSSEIYANDECAKGAGFGLNAGSITANTGAAVRLALSREGAQGAITIRRVRLWLIARLGGTGGNLFVSFNSGSSTHVESLDILGPPGGSTLVEPFATPTLAADTHIAHVALSCTGAPCTPASSNPLEIRGAEVTLNEAVLPTATAEGGPLLDGRPQSGVRGLSFSAADAESGVAEVSALLGSTVVATQDFRPDCAYAALAACAVTRSGSLIVDTRAVEDGEHPLSLRVTDAAANRQTISTGATITVANGAGRGAMASNGTSASQDARLTAGFVGRRGSKATVRYHQKAKIRGRLTTASGVPIGAARVEVVETPVGLPKRARIRWTTTAADGRFTYAVRARGMSRNLRVRYRPVLAEDKVAATRLLSVRVAAAGSLRVALHGIRVSYNGRVVSGPVPRRGLRVYLEGRAAGGHWTQFAIKRTTGRGRFSGRYRLRVRRPGVRLQFRLRIPRQSGYPYAAGVGPPVTRTVR
jgi:hypothetical protein